jgi:alpha-L-fucosidase
MYRRIIGCAIWLAALSVVCPIMAQDIDGNITSESRKPATIADSIYRTHPWRSTRQWSAGQVPKADYSGDFNSDYDVSKLASKPEPGKASIEAFYTTKGDNFFAILPRWANGTLTLKDAEGAKSLTLLGDPTALKFKNTGKALSIQLPDLPENLRQQSIWVLKISR